MMLLAIDTSTHWASLALATEETVIVAHHWAIGQQHSTQIFDGIAGLVARAGITYDAIDAIAVATGPGSFNGVRVAVTVAKTLAYVWKTALVGIPTLDGMAQSACDHGTTTAPLLALLDAGRGELYFGWYDLMDSGLVSRQVPLAISRLEDLLSAIQMRENPVGVVGELRNEQDAALRDALGDRLHWVLDPAASNRASGIARLACARLALGDHDAILTLEPTYIRRPNITISTRYPLPPEG